jgi:hypothetical protein
MPRPRSPIPPCEAVPALDVRRLAREGKLQPGRSCTIAWACDGEPYASIRLTPEEGAVILAFQAYGAPVRQRVPLTFTAQRLGGRRAWFVCDVVANGRRCGRRCGVLYVATAPVFGCRKCLGLRYAAQSESRRLRGLHTARKIRMSLGGGPSVLDPFPRRPPGMSREVYATLLAKYGAAMARLEASAAIACGRAPS